MVLKLCIRYENMVWKITDFGLRQGTSFKVWVAHSPKMLPWTSLAICEKIFFIGWMFFTTNN